MVKPTGNKPNISTATSRRRGRPTGSNRVPLSHVERRARNAEYERDRRTQTAEAFADLAEALGVDSNVSHSTLLATALKRIHRWEAMMANESTHELANNILALEREISEVEARKDPPTSTNQTEPESNMLTNEDVPDDFWAHPDLLGEHVFDEIPDVDIDLASIFKLTTEVTDPEANPH